MPVVNLLLSHPLIDDLTSISRSIGEALGEIAFAERESSNYIDERYFTSHIGNIKLILSLSEEIDHDDRPYWMAVRSAEMTEEELISFTDTIVKNGLIPNGFSVARFVSFGRIDEQRIDY